MVNIYHIAFNKNIQDTNNFRNGNILFSPDIDYLVQITYVILPPQHVHEDIFIPQIICSYSSHNTFHDIESDNVCYLEKNNFLVLRSNDQN